MIDLKTVIGKHGLSPKGVIHVGGHYAEEYNEYKTCGIKNMVFIEPCNAAFEEMSKRLIDKDDVVLIKVACGSEEGEFEMNVSPANEGQSNSLLLPLLHLQQHPEIQFTEKETVQVRRLDNLKIDFPLYDMLVMDVQGFEGEVLRGASETLKNIDIIYTEVNRGMTYASNMLIEEMDALLKEYGFIRVETYWPSPNWTWGDSIYIKG